MKLELKKYQPKNEIAIVEMKNKPALAKAMEAVKIRDYPEQIRNQNTASLVDWLLNLIGVNDKEGSREHHVVAFKHINETLNSYTYEEIKLAFEMYVNGEFKNSDGSVMQVFSELNARVIGKVMTAYTEKKRSELDAYYRERERQRRENSVKKYTEEEKLVSEILSLRMCHEEILENGEFPVGFLYVYDILFDWGALPKHTKEFRDKIMARAKERIKKSDKKHQETTFEKIVRNAEQMQGALRAASKEIIVMDFFEPIKTKEELEEIVRKLIENKKK